MEIITRGALKTYLKNRPLFLGIIRAKETQLYQPHRPFKRPILDFGCGDGFFAKVAFGKSSKPARLCTAAALLNPANRGDRTASSPELAEEQHQWNWQGRTCQVRCQLQPETIDIGLDIEGSRIKEARRWRIYKKLVTYNGKHLPFPDGYFSTIVSNSVLEHIPNLGAILSELSRVLKPDGLFLTTVMAKNWQEHLFGNLLFGSLYKKWMQKIQTHHQILSENEWRLAFTKAQFQVKDVHGYLDRHTSRLIDFLHYVSVGSLISYKLTGKWVLFPWQYDFFP